MTDAIVIELEEHLRRRARALVDPREEECLLCFVARALKELGCDNTLRWASRYRDLRAPRATALERRLGDVGGFCDCEIFLNGFMLASRACLDPWSEEEPPEDSGPPTCLGARRGSTKPCASWTRLRRW